MKIAIHQPNFLPWLGYFKKIKLADVFVILDNVDIVTGGKSAITNRAKVLTPNGELWLTIPLKKIDSKKIDDQLIDNSQRWKKKHLKTIELNYKKAPFFERTYHLIDSIYGYEFDELSHFNIRVLKEVCALLNISTKFELASSLTLENTEKTGRIIEICKFFNGTTYISGYGANKYNDVSTFQENNMDLIYTGFVHPIYQQIQCQEFIPGLSILDVLMNMSIEEIKKIIE